MVWETVSRKEDKLTDRKKDRLVDLNVNRGYSERVLISTELWIYTKIFLITI